MKTQIASKNVLPVAAVEMSFSKVSPGSPAVLKLAINSPLQADPGDSPYCPGEILRGHHPRSSSGWSHGGLND